jgi:hypothetical protein
MIWSQGASKWDGRLETGPRIRANVREWVMGPFLVHMVRACLCSNSGGIACIAQPLLRAKRWTLASTNRRYLLRRQPRNYLVLLRSSCHGTPAPRQPHHELGEVADLAIDCDRAAVLLSHNLIAYRQAESRTLAGRLGCEEGLE